MTLVNYLQYSIYSTFFPHLRDYISMGIGIEERYKRFDSWWSNHLSACRSLQRFALQRCELSKPHVTILGAGRLYDVDRSLLCESIPLTLYDRDPRSIKYLRRKFAKHSALTLCCEDVTGVMEEWSNRVRDLVDRKSYTEGELSETLSALSPCVCDIRGDIVISLNLLGQLGVHWLRTLDNFGLSVAGKATASLLKSIRVLEQSHLATLFSSQAQVVVLITDVRYQFYGNNFSCVESLSEPLEKLLCNCHALVKDYSLEIQKRWLWHIHPFGGGDNLLLEQPAIHDVVGMVFVRNS